MNFTIHIISNTVVATQITQVAAFLSTVPHYKVLKVENYSVGVAANFRLFTAITYIP